MGYTLSVKIKNTTIHRKLSNFLRREYRPYRELAGLNECPGHEEDGHKHNDKCFMSAVGVGYRTNDLSYAPDATFLIGFDYSSWIGDPERHYVWNLTQWVSLNGSEPKTTNNVKIYTYYYDDEEIQIALSLPPTMEKEVEIVDKTGYSPHRLVERLLQSIAEAKSHTPQRYMTDEDFQKLLPIFERELAEMQHCDTLVKQELQRLNDLWRQNNE